MQIYCLHPCGDGLLRSTLTHMASSSPRMARLQELLKMEERRSVIEEELNGLTSRMRSLRDSLFDDSAPAPSSSRPPVSRGRKPGRTPRGELKSQIIAALKSAGSGGVRVSELAKSLG